MQSDHRGGTEESVGVGTFFQDFSESGLRSQIEWCKKTLGLTDKYYAKLLGVEPREFKRWERGAGGLPGPHQDTLGEFWRLYLHLRTFYNVDIEAVKRMYEHVPSPSPGRENNPPW